MRPTPIVSALRRLRSVFLSVGFFSGVINVLALTGSFYMLQVYDRILPSQSVQTLIAMTVLLIGLYLVYGLLDVIRLRLMSRIGNRIDKETTEHVFAALPQLQLRAATSGDGLQSLRDLDQIRNFLSSLGPTALFDLPWLPIFLFVVFLLHPWLGLFATVCAVLLVAATLYTELRTRQPSKHVATTGAERFGLAQSATRNAEAIQAMGFQANLNRRWRDLNGQHTQAQLVATDIVGGMGSMTRVLRFCAQSGILGLGAYLVILGEVTAGTIIAASITMSRALAPIETAIAHWRGFIAARQSYGRLEYVFGTLKISTQTIVDPSTMARANGASGPPVKPSRPTQSLSVEQLTVVPPGVTDPTLMGVDFRLEAGDGLGVIGPSGAGKSTLARALVGVWKPFRPPAAVRLDEPSLTQYAPEDLGRYIGYMPQEIALFAGTVGENIARFDPDATSEDVIAAASKAGAHAMIHNLKDGYKTVMGDNGAGLSVGQRQRIALARALYKDPFFVVLDEPNANLDAEGENSLTAAIKSVRDRGGIVVVIAHRPAAIAAVNKGLALEHGRIRAFGPKADVLRAVLKPAPTTEPMLPSTQNGASNTRPNTVEPNAPQNASEANKRPSNSSASKPTKGKPASATDQSPKRASNIGNSWPLSRAVRDPWKPRDKS
ncbi:MAG: type I secretion system permease/ATPase [Pseudomonadota bacterium]